MQAEVSLLFHRHRIQLHSDQFLWEDFFSSFFCLMHTQIISAGRSEFFVCLICVCKSSQIHLQLSTVILAFFQCIQAVSSIRPGGLCFCPHNSNHLGNNVYIPELLTQHRKLGGNILSYITSIASWLGWERKWEY